MATVRQLPTSWCGSRPRWFRTQRFPIRVGWLALVTRSADAGGTNLLSLCILQLQAGGTFRDIADLGAATPAPAIAPVAWPPESDQAADRLAFVGPAPGAASGNAGLFGIFGALRPAPPPSGLFMI